MEFNGILTLNLLINFGKIDQRLTDWLFPYSNCGNHFETRVLDECDACQPRVDLNFRKFPVSKEFSHEGEGWSSSNKWHGVQQEVPTDVTWGLVVDGRKGSVVDGSELRYELNESLRNKYRHLWNALSLQLL